MSGSRAKAARGRVCSRVARGRFGSVAVIWSHASGEAGIERIFLSRGEETAEVLAHRAYPDVEEAGCAEADVLLRQVLAFLDGEPVAFDLDAVRWNRCSAFQQRVLRAESAIPRGWVSTYGRIARHLGVPTGARAVGTALATNPFPIVIPCHRAVRADGTLGGYQGGTPMKRVLLEMEGIPIDPAGRLLTRRFHY